MASVARKTSINWEKSVVDAYMTYSDVYPALAIDQSVWQSVRDSITISESSNNCIAATTAAAAAAGAADASDGM